MLWYELAATAKPRYASDSRYQLVERTIPRVVWYVNTISHEILRYWPVWLFPQIQSCALRTAQIAHPVANPPARGAFRAQSGPMA